MICKQKLTGTFSMINLLFGTRFVILYFNQNVNNKVCIPCTLFKNKHVRLLVRFWFCFFSFRSAQNCIVASLAAQFPSLKVVGEEGDQDLSQVNNQFLCLPGNNQFLSLKVLKVAVGDLSQVNSQSQVNNQIPCLKNMEDQDLSKVNYQISCQVIGGLGNKDLLQVDNQFPFPGRQVNIQFPYLRWREGRTTRS